MARTMLIDAHVPDTFWHDAVLTAVFVISRLPTTILQVTSPFHKLFPNLLTIVFYVYLDHNVFPISLLTLGTNFNLAMYGVSL